MCLFAQVSVFHILTQVVLRAMRAQLITQVLYFGTICMYVPRMCSRTRL
jgi:hypothetical protein